MVPRDQWSPVQCGLHLFLWEATQVFGPYQKEKIKHKPRVPVVSKTLLEPRVLGRRPVPAVSKTPPEHQEELLRHRRTFGGLQKPYAVRLLRAPPRRRQQARRHVPAVSQLRDPRRRDGRA